MALFHDYVTNPCNWIDESLPKGRVMNPVGAIGWDESKNEWRFRVEDPRYFRKNTFRYKKLRERYDQFMEPSRGGAYTGVGLIVAKYKTKYLPPTTSQDSMSLQALRFKKSLFTFDQAEDWIARYWDEIFRAKRSREMEQTEKMVQGKGRPKKARKSKKGAVQCKIKRAANPILEIYPEQQLEMDLLPARRIRNPLHYSTRLDKWVMK